MNKNWDIIRPQLQKVMDDSIRSGEECGCQLAIYHKGQLVIDLAAGFYTPAQARIITQDSLFPVFSCGKAIMATAMHRLVMRGLISYDTRIGDVWPEFDCNMKQDIQLWHLMAHCAGLQNLPVPYDSDEMAAWNYMCAIISKEPPANKPGSKCVYHALTFAWLMGEVASRITRKNCKDVIRDEVLAPLGIENEFFYGTSTAADQRFVPVDDHEMPNGQSWCAKFINNPALRHAVIPSANAVCTARALAKHYAALIDTVDGVRLLSKACIDNATQEAPTEDKSGLLLFGLGYALCGKNGNTGTVFGHGGACGSEGFADKENEIALGFTKNRDKPQHPQHDIRDRISDILEIPHRLW